jgi:ribose transport system substrate-binding protein
MNFRFSPLRAVAVVIVATACMFLASCKEEKPAETNVTVTTPPGKTTVITTAFDKPLKPDGDIKIQIITNGISPFWDAMQKGMEQMRAELKCEATRQSPSPPDNNAQKQVFDNAIAGQVNGIAVSPIQADAFGPVIDAAIDKGVPVITFDSDSEKSKRLCYLGTNNFEAGKVAGQKAVELMPTGGKIVAFVGNMSAQNARDRFNGFMEGVKGHNIECLNGQPFEDDKDVGRARRNVGDAITKFGGKITGFLGLYSYNGPAIVNEVEAKGLLHKVKIICFDGEPATLKNLEAGKVDVTVVQKPYEFGRLCTKLLYLTNRKGFKAAIDEMKPELETMGMKVNGKIIDTGVDVITPSNAKEFLKKLKEKGLEST